MSARRASQRTHVVPDEVIDSLLGKGLSYSEWRTAIESHPSKYTWTGSLKNTIIKREFLFFKPEILYLKSEIFIGRGKRDQPKPNSLETILKRLKGEPWMIGVPSERKQRLQEGRLLGKDARVRSLQNYVRDWEKSPETDPQLPSTLFTPREENAYGNGVYGSTVYNTGWDYGGPWNDPSNNTLLGDLFGGLTIHNPPADQIFYGYPDHQNWPESDAYDPNWPQEDSEENSQNNQNLD